MGYTTDFSGRFDLNNPLASEHFIYLQAFAGIRHMKRNEFVAVKLPDPVREAVKLPVGKDGAFYVGSKNDGQFGQSKDASILDYNRPPQDVPGLWCQWTPTVDGTGIEWDGGEKFYEYEAWLSYIVDNFLKPWGYKLNGTVTWAGEDSSDRGKLIVKDNIVTTK